MSGLRDHPLRYELANELHARPFPSLAAPCRAVHLAIKRESNAAARDRGEDRAHLVALLDRFGAPHPQPGATHWFGPLGRHQLKWECHTEFVTYTLFAEGVAERPFDVATFELFPRDWLADAPGVCVTSALIRVEPMPEPDAIDAKLAEWFVPESLAVSQVLDASAVVAGDFRIDTGGHLRFAVFATPESGPRRVGRIVQRLCEIETYKTLAMLGFSRSRSLGKPMSVLDGEMNALMEDMTSGAAKPEAVLTALLGVSAELEKLLAETAFRFGATGAYTALVNRRIEVLREERYQGRQTLAEFMMRRFEPAMRTVESTERRLRQMSERATRAGDLLRTGVDVERSAQNQRLLESMNRRADLQLRLQRTVEGLSVVAISYYAVSLGAYLLGPGFEAAGLSKSLAAALLVPPVVLGVWWVLRRIQKKMH